MKGIYNREEGQAKRSLAWVLQRQTLP